MPVGSRASRFLTCQTRGDRGVRPISDCGGVRTGGVRLGTGRMLGDGEDVPGERGGRECVLLGASAKAQERCSGMGCGAWAQAGGSRAPSTGQSPCSLLRAVLPVKSPWPWMDPASKSINGPGQEIIRNPGQALCCCDSCLIGRVGSLPPGHPRQHGVPSPCVPVPVLVAPSPTHQGVRRCCPGRTDGSQREAKSRGARCDSAVPFCLQTLTLGDR